MTERPDLEGVHVWTDGHADAGFTPALDDTRPLPPVPPPPARRPRSKAPLVVAALIAAGALGAASTSAITALTSHPESIGSGTSDAPGSGAGGPRAGQQAPPGPSIRQAPRLHVKGGEGRERGDGEGRGGDD